MFPLKKAKFKKCTDITQHCYNDNTKGFYCQPLCYPLFDYAMFTDSDISNRPYIDFAI